MAQVKERIAAARPYLFDLARLYAFQHDSDDRRVESATGWETALQLLSPNASRLLWRIKDYYAKKAEENKPFTVSVKNAEAPGYAKVKTPSAEAPPTPSPQSVPQLPEKKPLLLPYYPDASSKLLPGPQTPPPLQASQTPPTEPPSAATVSVPSPETLPTLGATAPLPAARGAWTTAPVPPPPPVFPFSPQAASVLPDTPQSRAPENAPPPRVPVPERETRLDRVTKFDASHIERTESLYAERERVTSSASKQEDQKELIEVLKELVETNKLLIEEMKREKRSQNEPNVRQTHTGSKLPFKGASPFADSDHRGSVSPGGDQGAMNAAIGRALARAAELAGL